MNDRIVRLLVIVGFLSVANLCAMDGMTRDVETQFNTHLRSGALNLKEARELLQNFVEQIDHGVYENMVRRLLEVYSVRLNYEGMESFLNFLIEHNAVSNTEAAGWYQRIESAVATSSSSASSSLPAHQAEFLQGLIQSARTALTVFPEPDATCVAAKIYEVIIKYSAEYELQRLPECQEAQRKLAFIQRDGI